VKHPYTAEQLSELLNDVIEKLGHVAKNVDTLEHRLIKLEAQHENLAARFDRFRGSLAGRSYELLRKIHDMPRVLRAVHLARWLVKP
jgi:hypothetical protein